ncbi:MAG: response regulator [Bacteroidota bacterium]|nr:response regulator [Bacteroidota bacterium]
MTKPITFFLVDDDTDDTSLFQEALEVVDPSIRFFSAINGQEALDKLRAEGAALPDLIFLDLNMPRMDGKQCLIELKNDVKLKDIPVIMYTTSSQSKDIEETMQRGALCFITKPASEKELKDILLAIAHSMPYNLEKTLRILSNNATIFIVC